MALKPFCDRLGCLSLQGRVPGAVVSGRPGSAALQQGTGAPHTSSLQIKGLACSWRAGLWAA